MQLPREHSRNSFYQMSIDGVFGKIHCTRPCMRLEIYIHTPTRASDINVRTPTCASGLAAIIDVEERANARLVTKFPATVQFSTHEISMSVREAVGYQNETKDICYDNLRSFGVALYLKRIDTPLPQVPADIENF